MNQPSQQTVLITGSAGLIGSEVCQAFDERGFSVHGLDNNQRREFFGPDGDTSWNQKRLATALKNYVHHTHRHPRSRRRARPDPHAPSRRASCTRRRSPRTISPPRFRSTISTPTRSAPSTSSKRPGNFVRNRRSSTCPPIRYMATRPTTFACASSTRAGTTTIRNMRTASPETFSIDQSKHSLFGASKVAADVMVQEYGRYFNMPTVCLRGGCLTGPSHSGVELHGFLSYLVKCNLEGKEYTVFGYKGKQVRDNIHSLDVGRLHARVHRQTAVRRGLQPGRRQRSTPAPSWKRFRWWRRSPESRNATAMWTRTASATTSAITAICARCSSHYPQLDAHPLSHADLRRDRRRLDGRRPRPDPQEARHT